MNNISLGRAWSLGTGFFGGLAANHAIILIVVGILVPQLLSWAIIGGSMSNMMNPAALASGEMLAGLGVGFLVVTLIAYILQYGSYFASWRQGLATEESVGSALTYGMIAGAVLTAIFLGTVLVFALLAGVTQTPLVFLPALVVILPIMMMMAAPFSGLFAIIVLIAAAFGGYAMSAMLGGLGGDASMGGGVLIVMLIVAFLLVWLAARFCCAAPWMAQTRSLNVLNALKASWSMTAASQWKLIGYFLLIGVVLLVLAIIVGMLFGAGMSGMMQGGDIGGGSIVSILLFSLLIGIPMAYLTVAVPAGIYKELGGANVADTFA